MNFKEIDKYQQRFEVWKDVNLEDIKSLFVQTMTREGCKHTLNFWTKEDQANDKMRLRWMITEFKFELDQLLKAIP